ncbi:MAG: carbon starvation protein A, partial [Calditrichaeota bacterium]|nr:carbon starvation protein A [Calditrichota bacterium]
LDTATRIQRYVVSELASDLRFDLLRNRYLATAVVVISAALLAFASGADGKGALALWPLFGAVNQTLGALALVVVTMFLRNKGGWSWIIPGFPAVFMSVMTLWASIMNQFSFTSQSLLLQVINVSVVLIVLWIVIESIFKFFNVKQNAQQLEKV